MTTKTALTAYDRLARVHPQHVERIEDAAAYLRPGVVVRYAEPWGGSSFFTGIRPGDDVVITGQTAGGYSVRLAADEERQGAHLSVYKGQRLECVPVAEWTPEEIRAAKRAAEAAERDALYRARHFRANGDDARALAALDDSTVAERDAFSLGALLTFHADPTRGTKRYGDGWL